MAERQVTARMAARARAQQIKGQRRLDAIAREDRICALLTRVYEAGENIARNQAMRASALGELHELIGNSAEVAELCGLTTREIRAATNAPRPDGTA
jgi:hypothetical protein